MLTYRKLIPAEAAAFCEHLLRLTPEDRRCRFTGAVSDAVVAEHCDRIDWFKTVIVGCFEDDILRGAVELCFGWSLLAPCEVAVTVERPWQNRGIGTELMRRAIIICRNRSIRTIQMICLLDNRRMQRIARKLDGELLYLSGEVEAEIALPFPTQMTLAAEAMEEGAAWLFRWWQGLHRMARAARA